MKYLWLIIGVFVTAGCASTTRLSTHYINSDITPRGEHLLIAARTPEPAVYRQWETSCGEVLAGAGFQLYYSHQVMPDWTEKGQGALLNWASNSPSELILMVDLTSLQLLSFSTSPDRVQTESISPSGPHDERGTQITLNKTYQDERKAAPINQDIRPELLRADGTPIWSGIAKTHEANEIGAIARSQCRALAKRFSKLGLPDNTP